MDNVVSDPSSPRSMCLVSVVKYPPPTLSAPQIQNQERESKCRPVSYISFYHRIFFFKDRELFIM